MFTDWAIMLGMVYVYLPLMVLPLYASMEKIDFRLVEAGYDLYATRLQVLRRIIIPLVKPGIIAGSILVFIPSLGAYVTPRVLGGGKNMMLGNLIELQFGQGRNWPLGCGTFHHPDGDGDAGPAGLRAQCLQGRGRPWLRTLFRPFPAGLCVRRDAVLFPALSAYCHAGVLCIQCGQFPWRSGKVFHCAGSNPRWNNRADPGGNNCARCSSR